MDVIRITRAIPQKERTLRIDRRPHGEGKPEAFRVVVAGMLTAGDAARIEPEAATATAAGLTGSGQRVHPHPCLGSGEAAVVCTWSSKKSVAGFMSAVKTGSGSDV